MVVLALDQAEMVSQESTRTGVLRTSVGDRGRAWLNPVARAAPSRGHRSRVVEPFLVVIELQGGNDGLNTVVPLTLKSYAARRPSLALSAAQCLTMNAGRCATDRWGLHPSLANLATLWRAGSLAVVPKVGYPQPKSSHFGSGDIWSYGVRDVANLQGGSSGWIARYVDVEGLGPLGAISVGMGRPRAFVGGAGEPLVVRDLESIEHEHPLAERIENAVAGYSSAAPYGTSSISRHLRDIAVLLQAGFETRVFYTGFGGFDTHGAQGTVAGTHANLLGQLDEALGAFAGDLQAMAIWDQAIIVVVSEFGRCTEENGAGGTDHGGGNHVLALGGCVNGGVRGADVSEADLDLRHLVYQVDFRSIYKEILARHLGASDVVAVFPEAQEHEITAGLV